MFPSERLKLTILVDTENRKSTRKVNNTMLIEIWLKPTPGDARFYERWEEVGERTENPREAEALVVGHDRVVTDDVLGARPKLRYIISPVTGHTHLCYSKAVFPDVKVLSLQGETEFLRGVMSVSEFVLRQMLAMARPKHGTGRLLNGKTLGIVGFGRIGKQVSLLAHAFGMRVFHVDQESPLWAWHMLFKQSDFVSIHLPETEETHGKVSRELIGMMKRDAFLINTARASVVDQAALMEALRKRAIAGAALDLWEGEENFDGCNAHLSHHVAGSTVEDRIRTDEFMVEKLKAHLGPRRVHERA